MKRIFLKIILVCVVMLTSSISVFAAPPKATAILDNAEIAAECTDDKYVSVKENLKISKLDMITNQKLEFTLSKINGSDPTDFSMTVNGKPVKPEANVGDSLTKYSMLLPAGDTEANITVSYKVVLPKSFNVPLFVPAYPTTGKESNVSISFKSPEGTYIQEDSFPVVANLEDGNTVSCHLSNVPSHITFKYGKNKNSIINFYNIISVVVFLALVIIIGLWVKAEMKNRK